MNMYGKLTVWWNMMLIVKAIMITKAINFYRQAKEDEASSVINF